MAVDRPLVFTVDALLRYPMSSRVIRVDCAKLSPFVAAPGDPGNGIPLSLFDHPVKVDIAYGGSCTAGKREDFDHYHEVPAWGLAHGLKVPPSVQLFLQYGTTAVRDYCIARGYTRFSRRPAPGCLQPSAQSFSLTFKAKPCGG
jgi:3-isopropylmalate/(R)-2-methylmalate dehydratase large subunit